ncbi:iron complex transport system ATP-binding protein [Rhizomicrobium palustre]|uniref:Iron complex transport system ATP-binding protein n=1 Tax=Rhizomicrobium palustre TaxID=189966 RepID=A0A846MZV6_9PROT|nr:ABC transporter ATP-binding protein [Rhizomicrobium palustre]NIK88775.1 iron complex transport system ATP-binding protein [Rhizomicrobium palustre]
MKLELRNLVCGYGAKSITEPISLSVSSGEALYLLGPNGSGKTTLFKTILGLLQKKSGGIFIDGEDVSHWPQRRLARALAYVPQAHTPPFPFSVREVVLTARTAHLGFFGTPSRADEKIADHAIETLGLSYLAHARYTEISGGERQLVLIARAVAQESQFLVLDEPTSNLDFGNQVKVLKKVRELTQRGLGLLITTHLPDQAFLCASRVALLRQGKLMALGKPQEVLTEALLCETYSTSLKLAALDGGLTVCVPLLQEG